MYDFFVLKNIFKTFYFIFEKIFLWGGNINIRLLLWETGVV
jgi:hypothetical protein